MAYEVKRWLSRLLRSCGVGVRMGLGLGMADPLARVDGKRVHQHAYRALFVERLLGAGLK
jgi:hypothetical protein